MLALLFRAAAVLAAASALTLGFTPSAPAAAIGPDPLTPPANRVGREETTLHALVGATVHTEPGKQIDKATIVVRDGRIVSVGADVQPPPGARVWDCMGLHIYAGFVEPYLEVDAPQPDPTQPGVHWNAKVTPQRRALDGKGVDEATAKQFRGMGFVAAAISPKGGIFRGQAAAVSLAKPAEEVSTPRPPVYAERVYHSVAFELGRGGGDEQRWGGYPGSEMGAIALIRQTLSDAEWEAKSGSNGQRAMGNEIANCLITLNEHGPAAHPDASEMPMRVQGQTWARLPLMFSVDDELEVLRAVKIAREFDRHAIVLGSGLEFRRLGAIHAALSLVPARQGESAQGAPIPLIIPLNFPDKPKVASVADAEAVELRELMTWEQAPTNPRRLAAAGVQFALTTSKLRDRNKFNENLRTAMRHGLTEDEALAALTTTPAGILGLNDQLGTIAGGKRASFIVADGPLFARKTKLRDIWVDGIRHELNVAPSKIEGIWEITLTGAPPSPAAKRWIVVDADNGITVYKDGKSVKAGNVSLVEGRLSFTFDHQPLDGQAGIYRVAATVDLNAVPPTITGIVRRPTGEASPFFATHRPPLAAIGKWLATEADAQLRDPANGSLTITITENSVTLNFVRKDKSKIEIKAEDVKFAPDGTLTFTHPLEPIGGTGKSSDTVTATGDTLTGESTLPDGSKHTYKAKKVVPKDERPAQKGMAGRWQFTLTDDKPERSKPLVVTISESGEVRANGEPLPEGAKLELTDTTAHYTAGDEIDLMGTRRGDLLFISGKSKDGPMTAKAVRTGYPDDTDEPDVELIAIGETPEKLGLPFGAYMRNESLKPQDVLLGNATVWTSGPLGTIEKGGVLLGSDGKIVWVGPMSEISKIPGPRPPEIDCTGKHITAGLIDCHSHTGISKGVNEGGQAVTAEVRIADVTNPDSISWYRQLAGGITTVNNLHGSANPIGGQNQVNKNRWGAAAPDDLHFEGAIPGIKFALGENVKWSNSDSVRSWRYPQTRMGVETIIRDRFLAAKEYSAAMKAQADKRTLVAEAGPRRDLELEALAEILDGKRIIHCHSYRQDEILMLARIAQDFGFKLGTYQHILEGYKVADLVRDSSGGGSCFADWWAYKVEVQDAIPQGGPIMAEQGVVVSFNSDSDEMARRMNVEAAKGHKYSRLPDGTYTISEEDALKFVTLNPAQQLRIDSKVGSLEKGKDADVAVWSGSPLSSLSRAEQTWIDGRCYWSLETDKQLREQNLANRVRITQRLLADGKRSDAGGGSSGGDGPRRPGGRPGADAAPGTPAAPADPKPADPAKPPQGLLARMLDDADAARRNLYLDFLRRGLDPAMQRSGVCGCE
ncbi:MAG: amidohydrolase family protein [Phycisphaerales bacterium]